MNQRKPRAAPVPHRRLSRLWQFGTLVVGVAGGMVAEGVRQLSRGELPSPGDLLLTPANAARVAERLSRLRGAAMKVGQLLSMEAGDVLPPELTAILARLRAEAHIMPKRQLVKVLTDAWGAGWEQRFEHFSFKPLAAASIGQVHRAETRDGRPLALKIQYPGIRQSIDSDVDNVATLLRTVRLLPAALDLAPLLDEAKRQLHREADYLQEAAHLRRYGALLGDDPDFVMPAVDAGLTTDQILAMSYLPGEPVETLADAEPAVRDQAATRLLRLLFRELFEFALVQTDPNFANYRFDPATGRLVLLDFGATRAYPPARVESYRRLFSAGLRKDRQAAKAAALDIGYLGEEDTAVQRDALAEIILTVCEPLRHPGPFDFAASDLVVRLRDLGLELSFAHGFWRAPPSDTVFLHRKFGGLYLLCARLGARVDVGALLAPYLERR